MDPTEQNVLCTKRQVPAAPTQRIDIKTGFHCNNRCRFCVQGDKRFSFGDKLVEQIHNELREAAGCADHVVFTGGETTMRRDLPDLIAFARSLGFRQIQIQTNGRMLAYRKLVERLIEAGATEFSPALHGPTAEIHEYLTQAAGSFEQTVAGIRVVKSLGQRVITNTVITRSNYRHLSDLASLLVKLGVDQFQFAFVHPVGSAKTNFHSIVPRMALIEPYVKEGLRIGLLARRTVMTEAIPYCCLQGFESCIAESSIPRTRIYDANFVLEDYTAFRIAEGKAKGPRCVECVCESWCEGPWREYPEVYGWDEFVPRTASQWNLAVP